MKLIIDIPENLYKWIKDEYDNPNEEVAYSAIENGTPVSTGGDLISREALKTAIEQGEGFSWDSYGKDDLCVRKKYIDNAPTVTNGTYEQGFRVGAYGRLDEIRPQGEWIKHSTYKDVLICSKCNHGSNQVYDTFNFCPNCGIKMKKGGAE